jgi:DNA-binding transcriptional MerR regulator
MAGRNTVSGRSTRKSARGTNDGGAKGPKKGAARRKSASDASAGVAKASPKQGELLPEGKLYYRIGEVAKITGVKPHVLRYWETEFRWMTPPKSRSKQRLYRRKDIEMILAIKQLLYEERYTIAGARQRLREMGLAKALERASGDAAGAEGAVGGDSLPSVRTGYRKVRDELEALRALL